jgi:hypothetical protein
MIRFTIRDLLWLTVLVALGAVLWTNHQHIRKLDLHIKQVERENDTWKRRASSLRDDLMHGSNKNTDVEFIPNGIRYTPKKSSAASAQSTPEPNS